MQEQQTRVARLSLPWHRAQMFDAKSLFDELRRLVPGLPPVSLVDGDDGEYGPDGDDDGFFYDLWVRLLPTDYDSLAFLVLPHGIRCEKADASLIDEIEDTWEKRNAK